MKYDPKAVFLVSAIGAEGSQPVSAVVKGVQTHQAAMTKFLNRHPGKNPLSVVSLAEMQASAQIVLDTVAGKNTGVEIIGQELAEQF